MIKNNEKWMNFVRKLFRTNKNTPSIITLSIMKESQSKLQGTQTGWFQWLLSDDNQLKRIESVDSIESLLKRHQTIQSMGIEHIVVLESGHSEFLPALKDQQGIKIIFRKRFPADVVNLLCQPDAEILATWQEICQNNPQKIHHRTFNFKNRTLAMAYGKSLHEWFKTLHQEDLINYLPTPERFFFIGEFTYIGIEKQALVFVLTAFPSAWLTLKNRSPSEIKIEANYAGAFIKAPKLKLGRGQQQQDWEKLDDSFWMKWLKHFRISKHAREEVGFIQSKYQKLDESLYELRQPMIWGTTALVGIITVAILFVFQLPSLDSEPKEDYFEQSSRGESKNQNIPNNSLSNVQKIYKKGYNLTKITTENEKEFVFWQLGQWMRFLDEGCSQEKIHFFNFDRQSQHKVANEFIDAFKNYEPSPTNVINELKNIQDLLSQKELSQNDLCDELASYRQFIFNELGD